MLFGCAAHPKTVPASSKKHPPIATPATRVPATSESAAPTGVGSTPPHTLAIAPFREIPRWFRREDPLAWYLVHPQQAPAGFRPLPDRSHRTVFPDRPYSEIWGYGLGHDSYLPSSCDTLEPDGTLCPTVVYPGRRLNEDQQRALVAITRNPLPYTEEWTSPDGVTYRRMRGTARDGHELYALFVFYDAQRRPVGVVELGWGCMQWGFRPAPKDAWVGLRIGTDAERATFVQLTRELELGRCGDYLEYPVFLRDVYGNPRRQTDEERQAEDGALLPAVLADWPAVDEDQALDETSREDRIALCAWFVRAARLAWSSRVHLVRDRWSEWVGLTDPESHAQIRLASYAECLDEFPDCAGTVRQARTCITRHLTNLWDQNEDCSTECAWGLSATPVSGE